LHKVNTDPIHRIDKMATQQRLVSYYQFCN
jgi:hypothetical protein